MRILAIETSCDETAISIVDADPAARHFRVRANETLSQIDIHRAYGGVFPMLAKREHARALTPLLVATLQKAGLYKETSRHVIEHPLRAEFQEIMEREPDMFASFIDAIPQIDPPKIDRIAVTTGPGLEPALWTGINFARALSLIWKTPVVPVDHMEGHIFAAFLQDQDDTDIILPDAHFPAVALLVSGGHTELVRVDNWGAYKILGATRDDAVGEAFDKVARLLGLPYPGGPEISRIGKNGTPGVYPLPRPMLSSKDLDFSFAGLKTAVLYLTRGLGQLSETQKADIAREFEDAAVDVLVAKTLRALRETGAQTLLVGGGVSANRHLKERLATALSREYPAIKLFVPSPRHATDNALMIALAGAFVSDETFGTPLRAEGHRTLS